MVECQDLTITKRSVREGARKIGRYSVGPGKQKSDYLLSMHAELSAPLNESPSNIYFLSTLLFGPLY